MERNGSASWLLECNMILCYCHEHQLWRNSEVFLILVMWMHAGYQRVGAGLHVLHQLHIFSDTCDPIWISCGHVREGGIGKTGGSNLNLHFHKIPLANQEARLQPQWYWCCLGSRWRCSIFSLTPHCRLASNRGERQYLDALVDAPRRSAPI